jgi:hypothetical protein
LVALNKNIFSDIKVINDADLEALVMCGVAQPEEVWKLNSVFVTGGGPLPTATVSLTGPNGQVVQV